MAVKLNLKGAPLYVKAKKIRYENFAIPEQKGEDDTVIHQHKERKIAFDPYVFFNEEQSKDDKNFLYMIDTIVFDYNESESIEKQCYDKLKEIYKNEFLEDC